MKNKIITFFLIIVFAKAYSQNDANTIFKTLLILDYTLGLKSNDSLDVKLGILNENVSIKSKELESLDLPYYTLKYKFYSFDFHNQTMEFKNKIPFFYNNTSCSEYVIVINETNNTYYRVKGFRNNDFLLLLRDIVSQSEDKLRFKKIVKDLSESNIKEIDFECIYNGLKDNPNNQWKYPCLTPCTQAIIVSGKCF